MSIDSILKTYEQMRCFYVQLKDHNAPSAEDLGKLRELRASLNEAIKNYYKYLNETGIAVKESYLTSWLEKGDYDHYDEEIEYFLNREIKRAYNDGFLSKL
jgi:hypothetical protein